MEQHSRSEAPITVAAGKLKLWTDGGNDDSKAGLLSNNNLIFLNDSLMHFVVHQACRLYAFLCTQIGLIVDV